MAGVSMSGRRRRGHLHAAGSVSALGLVQFTNRLQFALLFHAAVLKPDFDLALGERQLARQLDAPAARQVPVEFEVLLQL